jgi:hypothetical protein
MLAKDLVDRGVDVLVTIGTSPVATAKAATIAIPIIMDGSEYPVEHGLVRQPRRSRRQRDQSNP